MTTQLRGAWPGQPEQAKKERKKPAPDKPANLDAVKRTRTPYMQPRVDRFKSKYDDLFEGAQEGDCWETTFEDCAKISKALDTWCKRKGMDALVRQNARCPDGVARVWLYKVNKIKRVA
jgi:hypothetical protein